MPPAAREAPGFRAGFVALVGLPNVGKSTLLNRLVGERLSIVTAKAQTTRRRLRGIYTDDAHQAVFIDTPGLLDPRYPLQEAMRHEAGAALADADLVVAIVDAGFPPSLEWAAEFQVRPGAPTILCINKIDLVTAGDVEAIETELASGPWEEILPTDAEGGAGIDALKRAILTRLPESPPFYPDDELSDAPVREFVAELIRETCLEELEQEVPYAIAVRVEEFREREGDRPTYIEARIYVERESQKGIVIGKGGRMIRRIGSRARVKVERFLEQPVYLELRVKVLANWRKQERHLRVLGFRLPRKEA